MKISVSNLDDRSQTLVRGTKLRVSEKAEMIGDTEGDDALSSLEPEPVVNRTKAHKKAEVIDEMIQPLPKKLNDEKPRKVQRLLKDNEGQRSYLYCSTRHSKDAFDWTPNWYWRSNTHQTAPSSPLQHLEIIDKQVEGMKTAGIVETAASPWASDVVLVKKKDGSLRFCVDYRRYNAITYKNS